MATPCSKPMKKTLNEGFKTLHPTSRILWAFFLHIFSIMKEKNLTQ
jgi:hypothetical protein